MSLLPCCDIFCRVIDNFGDAGVAWRLAHGLASEAGFPVRFFIDRIETLAKLVPEIRPEVRTGQRLGPICVLGWEEAEKADPSPVVIETFACRLPEIYEAKIAARAESGRPYAWINLEYLSAEDWVEEFNGLPSPHPKYGTEKLFLFPGFTPRTAGLMIEPDLEARRLAFGRAEREALLARLGAKDPRSPFNLFYFAYPDAPAEALAESLAADPRPVQVIAAPGEASALLGQAIQATGAPHVTFSPIPGVPQSEFDALLWSCDALVVRGEDSFVRAQLACKPFLWTIYRQTEETHIKKLLAFHARYDAVLEPEVAAAWRELALAWNRGTWPADGMARWRDLAPELLHGALRWRDRLAANGPLVGRLAQLIKKRLQYRA